jgi:hypothetical protein
MGDFSWDFFIGFLNVISKGEIKFLLGGSSHGS